MIGLFIHNPITLTTPFSNIVIPLKRLKSTKSTTEKKNIISNKTSVKCCYTEVQLLFGHCNVSSDQNIDIFSSPWTDSKKWPLGVELILQENHWNPPIATKLPAPAKINDKETLCHLYTSFKWMNTIHTMILSIFHKTASNKQNDLWNQSRTDLFQVWC